MSTVVVVTTQALSSEDAAELIDVAGGEAADASFYVAVPEEPTSASMDAVLTDWELGVTAGKGAAQAAVPERLENPAAAAEHDAKLVLATSVDALRTAGAQAEGIVTPHHPLDSIGDLVAHHAPDEVVVMVRHRHLSELTASDLAAKIRRNFKVETLRVKAH